MGPLLSAVGITLGEVLGRRVDLRIAGEAGGGCINQAYRVTDRGQNWFVKINQASRADMFAAEADGLHARAGPQYGWVRDNYIGCTAIYGPATPSFWPAAHRSFSIPPPTTAIARPISR